MLRENLILWTAIVLLLWTCYEYGAFLAPEKTIVAVAAPALGLVWAALLWVDRSRRARAAWSRRGSELLLFALGCLGALSALWSLDPWESLVAAGTLFGGLAFLHLGCELPRLSLSARSSLLFVLGEAGAIVSVIAVVSWLFRQSLFTQRLEGTLLVVGTFGYANAFAGFLLLTMAATAALFLDVARRDPAERTGIERLLAGHPRGYLAAMIVPQVPALVLTRPKAVAAIAAFLLLVVLAVQTFGRGSARRPVTRTVNRLRLGLIVLLVLAFAGGGVLLWRDVAPQMSVSGLPTPEFDPETGEQLPPEVPMTASAFRVKTWNAALHAAAERPWLGYGLDTFLEAYSPFKQGAHTAYAHNLLVQQLVELGVVGLALLLGLLALLIARPLKFLGGSLTDPRFALLMGVLAFVLHNMVDLTWYFPALLMIFMLLAGMLLSWEAPAGAGRAAPDRAAQTEAVSQIGADEPVNETAQAADILSEVRK